MGAALFLLMTPLKTYLSPLRLKKRTKSKKTMWETHRPLTLPSRFGCFSNKTCHSQGPAYTSIKQEQAEDKESSLPLWQLPIIRRDRDFRNTGKPKLGGSSWSSGVFEEISTKKEWLGKSDQSPELAEAFACKGKIDSDIYAFYGASTSKIVLSKQYMTNTFLPGYSNVQSVHT